MSTPIDLRAKVQQFLLERRNLGFTLDSRGEALLTRSPHFGWTFPEAVICKSIL
jgi:hypothetical protein